MSGFELKDVGQNVAEWSGFWKDSNPETEIKMWDYYGLRQWILKYTPRFGKVLEAGCGLGRYVLYLQRLGINIEGLDFEGETINKLNKWKKKNNFSDVKFIQGDVTDLPYENESLSGYISLGVVEHFIEGPQKPIEEAYRALKPGGIAIITTPAPSWSKFYSKYLGLLKSTIKKLSGRTVKKRAFFQYEFSPKVLKRHIEKQGFFVSRYTGADWLYTFTEFGDHSSKYIDQDKIGYKVAHCLENSVFSYLGAQSIVIAIKADELMHCFLCDKKDETFSSLSIYDVPICNECKHSDQSNFYLKETRVSFHNKYIISPPTIKSKKEICEICKEDYLTDRLFENFGFDKNICPACLKIKDINIMLSNTSVQPVWRKRIV